MSVALMKRDELIATLKQAIRVRDELIIQLEGRIAAVHLAEPSEASQSGAAAEDAPLEGSRGKSKLVKNEDRFREAPDISGVNFAMSQGYTTDLWLETKCELCFSPLAAGKKVEIVLVLPTDTHRVPRTATLVPNDGIPVKLKLKPGKPAGATFQVPEEDVGKVCINCPADPTDLPPGGRQVAAALWQARIVE